MDSSGSGQWQSVLGKLQSRLHLLDQFNLSVKIDRLAVCSGLKVVALHGSSAPPHNSRQSQATQSAPNFLVSAELPLLHFRVDEEKVGPLLVGV